MSISVEDLTENDLRASIPHEAPTVLLQLGLDVLRAAHLYAE